MAYRILKEWHQYSKRKGINTKRYIVVKNLPDIKAVDMWIKENYPTAKKLDDKHYITRGFLFPGKLIIEGKPIINLPEMGQSSP